jgi:hypothetical protein
MMSSASSPPRTRPGAGIVLSAGPSEILSIPGSKA